MEDTTGIPETMRLGPNIYMYNGSGINLHVRDTQLIREVDPNTVCKIVSWTPLTPTLHVPGNRESPLFDPGKIVDNVIKYEDFPFILKIQYPIVTHSVNIAKRAF